ncbi:MAG: hypothetical protein HSCHL_0014 [Hydrogenibacillus schlegelii]|uniref:Uncharacterized protein n=1 Tax=Hydrogenibacillus schlegelii TaxID=1484 RepID=A0A2T5G997_HYDSH|nr:MAG: hypothetical protein HSCHL_0014 [Hydrogenibacillus schlegelii]
MKKGAPIPRTFPGPVRLRRPPWHAKKTKNLHFEGIFLRRVNVY